MLLNKVLLIANLALILSVLNCDAVGKRVRRFLEAAEHVYGDVYPHDAKAESKAEFWINKAQNILKTHVHHATNVNHKQAKNIIIFLGDGMSLPTVAASRIYKGQRLYNVSGEEHNLFFETFPYTGLSKTYCVNKQVADSACSATAYLCGVKGNFETIGVSAAVGKNKCEDSENPANHVNSIAAWAQAAGKATGIVSTARVTHASPSGTYAHTSHRDHESDADVKNIYNSTTPCQDIGSQLVNNSPGNKLKVIMGGGRQKLLPKEHPSGEGERLDGVNLIEKWLQSHGKGAKYVTSVDELRHLDYKTTDHLMALFTPGHMEYRMHADQTKEPSLTEMTEAAIKILQKESKGFFLFVEGGKIDYAHHATKAREALDETVEFDKAIEAATKLISLDDTLIVVTADHAHVMTIAGYSTRGNDILALNTVHGADEKPYATLSYANGPGYRPHVEGERPNLVNDTLENYPAMVPLTDETHGGDDVGVFAVGPWSDLFTGAYEQNAIPHMMAYASCIGDGETYCKDKSPFGKFVDYIRRPFQ